ncbi:MAG TPA: GAF domain-containing protein [Mycobacteriales bacterium]|jgi:signal transduction histidine kinase|nr:GAF domain-containing protein [Mycobacteriales bacterium]
MTGLLPGLDQVQLPDLLAEVSRRIEDLLTTGDVLRGLLEAVVSVGEHLELPVVLQRIVEAAVQLTGASYGALGVLGQDRPGELVEFVTVGLDDAARAALGPLPRGRGILGLLIDDPRPLRLTDLSSHPASFGVPPGHPPMASFLGVPIRVRAEVFGNLYLTEKRGGAAFTAEDEQVIIALAAAAGVALDNARLFERGHARERWLAAAGEVTTQLLAGESPAAVLALITRSARALASADLSYLGVRAEGGELIVQAADGTGAERLLGSHIPAESMSGRVLATGRSLAVADAQADPRVWQEIILAADAGATLFVPLRAGDQAVGTLIVANRAGGAQFSTETLKLVESFADQAALALRLGEVARDRERLAVFEDRDRIALDLHDLVIQRLFAAGMRLQSLARRLDAAEHRDTLLSCVDDLDDTIRELRSSIYQLQAPLPATGQGLQAKLLQTAQGATDALGFPPSTHFDGPLDRLVPPPIAEHVLAVVREALSNAARHAEAKDLSLSVSASPPNSSGPGRLTVRIVDHGKGLPESGRRSGLDNLAQRAHGLGGEFSAGRPSTGEAGTELIWWVPLEAASADRERGTFAPTGHHAGGVH